jgi:hypothetical protein
MTCVLCGWKGISSRFAITVTSQCDTCVCLRWKGFGLRINKTWLIPTMAAPASASSVGVLNTLASFASFMKDTLTDSVETANEQERTVRLLELAHALVPPLGFAPNGCWDCPRPMHAWVESQKLDWTKDIQCVDTDVFLRLRRRDVPTGTQQGAANARVAVKQHARIVLLCSQATLEPLVIWEAGATEVVSLASDASAQAETQGLAVIRERNRLITTLIKHAYMVHALYLPHATRLYVGALTERLEVLSNDHPWRAWIASFAALHRRLDGTFGDVTTTQALEQLRSSSFVDKAPEPLQSVHARLLPLATRQPGMAFCDSQRRVKERSAEHGFRPSGVSGNRPYQCGLQQYQQVCREHVRSRFQSAKMSTQHSIELMRLMDVVSSDLHLCVSSQLQFPALELLADVVFLLTQTFMGPWFQGLASHHLTPYPASWTTATAWNDSVLRERSRQVPGLQPPSAHETLLIYWKNALRGNALQHWFADLLEQLQAKRLGFAKIDIDADSSSAENRHHALFSGDRPERETLRPVKTLAVRQSSS